MDGELPHPQLPIIPGHEIVGRVDDAIGAGVTGLRTGERVGIPGWATLAVSARTAGCSARTFAIDFLSPVTRATLALPPRWSPTRASPFRPGAGASDKMPPKPLDAAIIFATVGGLVVLAQKAVRKGGRVVLCWHPRERHPEFPYSILWEERNCVGCKSNPPGWPVIPCLAPQVEIVTKTTLYPL